MLTMATANEKCEQVRFSRSPATSSFNCSFGSDLDVVLDDRKVKCDPTYYKNRRTIVVQRENTSFGFTLASYAFRRKNSDDAELITYVDYVDAEGPACKAGMRAGDVILSVNGKSLENTDHENLVDCIRNCEDSIRMVVVFEDVCRKIELHMKYFKLKKTLDAKLAELTKVQEEEAKILKKVGIFPTENVNFTEALIQDMPNYLPSIDTSPSAMSSASPIKLTNSQSSQSGTSDEMSFGSPMGLYGTDQWSPDDVFWGNAETGYGSLPVRSRKRSIKSCPNPSNGSVTMKRIVNRVRVGSTLFEEHDETHDAENKVNNKYRNDSKSKVFTPDTAPPLKLFPLKSKFSASVPNLIKLKTSQSVRSPSRPRIPFFRSASKQKLSRDEGIDDYIGRDPRTMTKHVRQQISNFVITENVDRKPSDPQLVGFRLLSNEFQDLSPVISLRKPFGLPRKEMVLSPLVNDCSLERPRQESSSGNLRREERETHSGTKELNNNAVKTAGKDLDESQCTNERELDVIDASAKPMTNKVVQEDNFSTTKSSATQRNNDLHSNVENEMTKL